MYIPWLFPTPVFITPGRVTAVPAFPDHCWTTDQHVSLAEAPTKSLLLPWVLVNMKPCVRPPGSCYTCSFLFSSQSYCTFPSFFFFFKFIYFSTFSHHLAKGIIITYVVLSTKTCFLHFIKLLCTFRVFFFTEGQKVTVQLKICSNNFHWKLKWFCHLAIREI